MTAGRPRAHQSAPGSSDIANATATVVPDDDVPMSAPPTDPTAAAIDLMDTAQTTQHNTTNRTEEARTYTAAPANAT